MRKPLTARQQEIYDFIADKIRHRGIPPTIREIGDQFGMRSSNGAREALNALARKGYIRRHDRLSRGIELVDPVEASDAAHLGRKVPVIRQLPVGSRHVDQATVTRHIVVDSSLLPGEEWPFAVVVPDNSLSSLGIRAGDYAIAVAAQPQDGEVAVVLEGSRLLVRRIPAKEPSPASESANGEGAAAFDGSEVKVRLLGRVRCILRAMPG